MSGWISVTPGNYNHMLSVNETLERPSQKRCKDIPASMEPDQRSTILSIVTSNSSLSRSGRVDMTMASLNSPRALGRDAVLPLLLMLALRPWRWWNLRSSGSPSTLASISSDKTPSTAQRAFFRQFFGEQDSQTSSSSTHLSDR